MEFDGVLKRLKHAGCNLLVTGRVPEAVTARATRLFLGSPSQRRRRVVALTDTTQDDVAALLPGAARPDDDDVRVVDHRNGERTAAAVESADSNAKLPTDGLRTLREDVHESVDELLAAPGPVEPGELRLSVVTLRVLVDRHGVDAVRSFVDDVGRQVTDVDGMAHYHLPIPDDAEAVERLEPAFDARIELRQADGISMQRWLIPGVGRTNWVAL